MPGESRNPSRPSSALRKRPVCSEAQPYAGAAAIAVDVAAELDLAAHESVEHARPETEAEIGLAEGVELVRSEHDGRPEGEIGRVAAFELLDRVCSEERRQRSAADDEVAAD